MKNLMKIICLTALPLLALMAFSKPAETTLGLKEAIKRGMVKCNVFNNPKGTHYQKPIVIYLTNLTSAPLKISIDNGTMFYPEDSSYQTLLVTQGMVVGIDANGNRSSLIQAVCTESSDRAPGTDTKMQYSIGKDAVGNLLKLSIMLEQNQFYNAEAQAAVWTLKNNGDLTNIYGYDTVATRKLQVFLAKLMGKKVPPPPAPDDYRRNSYAPTYRKKITLGGEFEFNFFKTRSVIIGMYDKNNILVRELYKNTQEAAGNHIFKYEFDASVYTDDYYNIKLIADDEVRLQAKVEMN